MTSTGSAEVHVAANIVSYLRVLFSLMSITAQMRLKASAVKKETWPVVECVVGMSFVLTENAHCVVQSIVRSSTGNHVRVGGTKNVPWTMASQELASRVAVHTSCEEHVSLIGGFAG